MGSVLGCTSPPLCGDDCWQGNRVRDVGDGGPDPADGYGAVCFGCCWVIGGVGDELRAGIAPCVVSGVVLRVDMIGCGCRASVRDLRRVVGGGLLGLLGPAPHVVRGLVLALKLDIVAVDKLIEVYATEDARRLLSAWWW